MDLTGTQWSELQLEWGRMAEHGLACSEADGITWRDTFG